jgi:hypothetical protein
MKMRREEVEGGEEKGAQNKDKCKKHNLILPA